MSSANLTEMQDKLAQIETGINSFFLLTMGLIVFLMQCGFAFLEAGSVRSKNTTNILIKNLLDSCISGICYWALGWALAYGDNSSPLKGFCGGSDFLAIHMEEGDYASWWFQFVFAATASTIVSGALAERCEFVAYFAYCSALTAFVYPIVTHWAWHSDGWLLVGPGADVTYVDFAGSGVVHVLGGTCAFVGAWLLGPRKGRFDKTEALDLKGHSVPFAALGGFILMFGFFAFNGGSKLTITGEGDGETVALAMFNTMLSGGSAAITTLLTNKFTQNNKWSLLLTINAALAGMVSACAGCDRLYPWAALVVGVGSGLSYMAVAKLVEMVKVDDPLDAVGVHFGGGFWGLFITPILMKDIGVIYAGDTYLPWAILGWNVLGGLVITLWSAVTLGLVFFIMKLLKLLRVPEEVEVKGLDIFKHGEPAYPLVAYGHGWADEILRDNKLTPKERARRLSQNLSLGATPVFENAELHSRHRTAMIPEEPNGESAH